MKPLAVWLGGAALSYAAWQSGNIDSQAPKKSQSANNAIVRPAEEPPDSISRASGQESHFDECLSKLREGRKWLQGLRGYTATFYRQERVDGNLLDQETNELKVRHQPFSVALISENDGREVRFQEGANHNRMLVKLGGWRGRLGWMKVDTHSSHAMAESRYAITDVGLLRLTDQVIKRMVPYEASEGVKCTTRPDELIGGRRCQVFEIAYASESVNPDYKTCTIWLDREWQIPLSVRATDWQAGSGDGLVEYYCYERIQTDLHLTDHDFSTDQSRNSQLVSTEQ